MSDFKVFIKTINGNGITAVCDSNSYYEFVRGRESLQTTNPENKAVYYFKHSIISLEFLEEIEKYKEGKK